MHFSITVRVLASNKDDLRRGDGQSAASPQRVPHPHLVNDPVVLLHFEDFNRVVDLLLGTAEEASKSVDELVVDGAGGQVVALILHWRNLHPFVFLNNVLFDAVESLLA